MRMFVLHTWHFFFRFLFCVCVCGDMTYLFSKPQKRNLIVSNIIPSLYSSAMDKRTACSVLLLCLLLGTFVGQSTSKLNMTFSECYTKCLSVCYGSSRYDYRIVFACMRCDALCRKHLYGQFCFLKWCWKVKEWGWKLFSFFFFFLFCVSDNWEYWSSLETMLVIRTSTHLWKVMILINKRE